MRLIAASPAIDARFALRRVLSERGEVQMVVLEATLVDPRQVERVETCMRGTHAAIVPAAVVATIAS